MKQTLYLIFSFGFSIQFIAQNNCDHSVITNWSGPINSALPYTPESPSVPDSKYLNAFNWTSASPIQLSNMQYNQQMVALKNPQQPEYYGYIYNGEDLKPENGWELLLFNIGSYPNLVPNPNGEIPDVPYIVLYNRYSGVVRVFANYGSGFLPTGISFDAVKVILKFDENSPNKSGILRLNEGKDRTLDQVTTTNKIISLAKHPNAPGKWFSTDFQVTYDPCVCYFPSDMRINFEFITSESLELHGRSISIEQDLISGTALETKDYLSNFDYTGVTADGGMIMYKALGTLVDDYEAKLEKYRDNLVLANEHNEKVERNLAVVKLFKHTVLQGGNAIISEIAGKVWFNDVITYANDLVGDTVVTKEQIVKEAKKGFAKGLDQLIVKNFQKMPTPTSPNTPMATFSEMHFQGSIGNETFIGGPNFYTPGTYGSSGTGSPIVSSALKYPVYNDALGVFALLSKPKINISKTVPLEMQKNKVTQNTVTSNTGSYRIQLYRYQTWAKSYQFQLAEDLNYIINSALDVKNFQIEAGFNIIAKPTFLGKPASVVLNSFHDQVSNVNISSTNTNVFTDAPIISNDRGIGYYELPNYDISNYNLEFSKSTSSKIYEDNVLIQTPFLPIDAFQPMVAGIGIRNEAMNYYENFFWDYDLINYDFSQDSYGNYTWNLNDPDLIKPTHTETSTQGYEYDFEIELKLIIDIEFNTLRSDGSPNSITQIHTFDIAPEDITWLVNDIIPNISMSTENIGQFQQNINFFDTDFYGQPVQGCELNGTEYTCQAWNNIFVAGNISTSNGYTAKLKAGNEIYVINESIVNPEIELSINPILNYSHPMPMANGSYVQQFCQGTLGGNAPAYQANIPNKTIFSPTHEENADSGYKTNNGNWDFSLYPNPTSSGTKISLNSTEFEIINARVTDMTGKMIDIQKNSPNSYSMNLDFTNSAKGFYLITILTKDGTKTKQLIVQ
jgi:hypothetical protein